MQKFHFNVSWWQLTPKKYAVLAQEIEFCENNIQYLWTGVMLLNPSPLSNGKCAIIPSKKEIWLDTDKKSFKSISPLSIHRLF